MDRLLFVVGTGAAHIERAQAAHANNLANVNTTGFRRDFAQARTMQVIGDGHATRHYALAERPGSDFSQGVLDVTGRSLDIAIEGEGFIALELADGSEAFTRAGNLQVDALGQLRTATGEAVMGNGGLIALPPYETVTVGADGTITVRGAGQGPEALIQAGQIKLVNPAIQDIEKRTDGFFERKDGLIEPPSELVQVASGFLEGSNVNAVSEMTSILGLARQFEVEVRLMRVAEENDESAARLLQVG